MLSILSALPIIGDIIKAITEAFFNAKVSLTQARVGGDRDVAVELVKTQAVVEQQQTAKLSIIAGNKMLTILILMFAFPLVAYEWKIVVYDIVLSMGSTDPIRGQVADWATVIIGSIFGSSTVMTLGNMWFRNRSQ